MKLLLDALALIAAVALGIGTGYFLFRITVDIHRTEKKYQHLKRWHQHMAMKPFEMTEPELRDWAEEHEDLEDEGRKLGVPHYK